MKLISVSESASVYGGEKEFLVFTRKVRTDGISQPCLDGILKSNKCSHMTWYDNFRRECTADDLKKMIKDDETSALIIYLSDE